MKNQNKHQNDQNNQKKERNVITSGALNGIKSVLCTVVIAAIISAFLVKANDPARDVFAVSLICSVIGGILCALFSLINCKNDVLLCSSVSGLFFCIVAALCSLMFDNTGKDPFSRALPLCVIMIFSVTFGLIFKGARKKKKRSLR